MKEKLLEMLKMQHEYNELVFKEHGKEKYTFENLECALFDELGELNHELKANWCWWKHTQKPVDRQKVLEEYIDCIHFGLCLLLSTYEDKDELNKIVDKIVYANEVILRTQDYVFYYENIFSKKLSVSSRFSYLLDLGAYLWFTFDEIYEAYKKKNKINQERLKNGY